MKAERALRKQAKWQKKRKDLPWAKKVRMVEAAREDLQKLSRKKKRTSA